MNESLLNPADEFLDEDDLDTNGLAAEFQDMTPANVGAEATGTAATAALKEGKAARDKIAVALWQQFAHYH
jgi:hypothetical protein